MLAAIAGSAVAMTVESICSMNSATESSSGTARGEGDVDTSATFLPPFSAPCGEGELDRGQFAFAATRIGLCQR